MLGGDEEMTVALVFEASGTTSQVKKWSRCGLEFGFFCDFCLYLG